MSCFTQTCTQTVTGRNFRYSEALNNVQNEFYLDQIDDDFLRKRIGRENLVNIDEEWRIFQEKYSPRKKRSSRKKRFLWGPGWGVGWNWLGSYYYLGTSGIPSPTSAPAIIAPPSPPSISPNISEVNPISNISFIYYHTAMARWH